MTPYLESIIEGAEKERKSKMKAYYSNAKDMIESLNS